MVTLFYTLVRYFSMFFSSNTSERDNTKQNKTKHKKETKAELSNYKIFSFSYYCLHADSAF